MLQVNLRRLTLSTFRHWGALGLFFLAIIDSSPVPTFCGPDLLMVVLVVARRHPWYEFAPCAAMGSTIGAYLTFRLARKAGQAYLEDKFGKPKVHRYLNFFKDRATLVLIVSSAVPFPFPTSLFFAAAGVSEYQVGRFLAVVALSRGARYSIVGALAARYGREVGHVLLHPAEHWGWLVGFLAVVLILSAGGYLLNRRMFYSVHSAPSH